MLPELLLAAAAALPSQERLERALLDAVEGSCPGHKVELDRDMTRAAQRFVAAAREGTSPAEASALSFYTSLESSEPSAVAGLATISPPSNADRAVGEIFPKTCQFNRVATAAAAAGGEALVAVLVARHESDLSTIPGVVQPGATVSVSGRLSSGLSNPRLFVTRPGGTVDELPLPSNGPRYGTKIALAAKGEHSIEILADGPGGPQVVAVRRVFAGVTPPESPPPAAIVENSLNGVETAIAQLRAARGLPKLVRDPELDAVARGHSEEMARLRVFAHVLPTDGNLGDRLRARGYAYRGAGENIGLSDGPVSAHEAIVGSPAHLANLLDPRHQRLGLGLARGTSPDGAEGIYLTEVLASPIVGSSDPAGDVTKALQAERHHLGLPPLSRDAALDEVAGKEVRAVALAGNVRLSADLGQRALDRTQDLQSVGAELYVVGSPDEASRSKKIAEPRWTRLGVGTLYASSKTYGPGRLWVVLLYGR